MKKQQQTIRYILGVTQLEMAMILQIHPSQWSMFESGKRSLPAGANLLLAEMLNHMKTSEASKKLPAKHEETNKEELKKWLKENEYQLETAIRKTAVMEKKYDAKLKALQLSTFSASNSKHKEAHSQLLKSIESKAAKGLEKNGPHQLLRLQIKEKLLQYEKELLLEALNTSTGSV